MKKSNSKNEAKLPKAFKKKWLKALRSGKYKQGNSFLRNPDNNTYCCLGVACSIAGAKSFTDKGIVCDDGTITRLSKFPPILIAKESENWNNKIVDKLVSMNDSGKSFKKIANYIEKYL